MTIVVMLKILPKMTRIGGMIGVGKNLVWIVIFMCTSFTALSSFIHRKFTDIPTTIDE